jgi:hypothetical protein
MKRDISTGNSALMHKQTKQHFRITIEIFAVSVYDALFLFFILKAIVSIITLILK